MTLLRRDFIALLGCALAIPRRARATAMSRITAYAFAFRKLDGGDIRLADYAGKPILIVNTASLCGYTPQYAGLQELWTRYRNRGLLVIGVPSNDFGGQEPGGAADIDRTAHGDYHVTFPLAVKAMVKGDNLHPFYKWAAIERPLDIPRWNFHKYLIGRHGTIVAVFPSAVEPTDPSVIAAIEKELVAA
jgi:glutathione peroxidase